MGVVFSLGYTWVFTKKRPYKARDNNDLGVTLAYSLVLLYLAALMIKVDSTSDSNRDQMVLGIFLVCVVVIGPLAVLYQYMKPYLKICCAPITKRFAKKEEDVMDATEAAEHFRRKSMGAGGVTVAFAAADMQLIDGVMVAMSTVCAKCGNSFKGDAVYCRKCGTKRMTQAEEDKQVAMAREATRQVGDYNGDGKQNTDDFAAAWAGKPRGQAR